MKVVEVRPGSPAERIGLCAGDLLIRVNGEEIRDSIDYRFCIADESVELLIERSGRSRTIPVRKMPDEDLGIALEEMKVRTCRNRCVFCFVDQLPPGMRRTLYVKDDDYRLSFLHGAYVTLTSLEEEDLRRIIRQRLSPFYISVHTTSPELRCRMMGGDGAGEILERIRFLAENDIELHGQVVVCPGWNDGEELDRTVETLSAFFPQMRSLALVPVGLTRYRTGLPRVMPVDRSRAKRYVSRSRDWGRGFLRSLGEPFVYLADEMYLLAGDEIPQAPHYAEFPQIENGVGMARAFMDGFREERHRLPERVTPDLRLSLVTGTLAAPILNPMVRILNGIPGLSADLIPVSNAFFGERITTSGLLTGRDIVRALRERTVGEVLLLPPNCMNSDGVLLDDMSPEEIGEAVGARTVVSSYELADTVCGILRPEAK